MSESTTDTTDIVQNRSEIVFLFDCVDANPNGNPLSGANRPRIDAQTQQGIVTDVCLKRYIRDQFDDDGLGVFIRNANDEDGFAPTREALLEACVDIDDPEDVDETILDEFLDYAIDARMFGATLAISTDDDTLAAAISDETPQHLTGAVQFSPARSLHAVELNENYNSLTSVIGTQEEKEQGGFDLDDHRLKYGYFRFHGVVNENAAETTQLTGTDVNRLDRTVWRALKNQTDSRAKMGQEPRVYLRVESAADNFHIGDLHTDVSLDEERSKPDAELRTIRDACLDVTRLRDRLAANADRIDTVHFVASDAVRVSCDGEEGGADLLRKVLADAVDGRIADIDVYDQAEA